MMVTGRTNSSSPSLLNFNHLSHPYIYMHGWFLYLKDFTFKNRKYIKKLNKDNVFIFTQFLLFQKQIE